MPKVAAIQMVSTPEPEQNFRQAETWIAAAAQAGAGLAVLPENFAHMGRAENDKLALSETPGQGPIQSFLQEQSSRHGIWLVGGTIPMKTEDPQRVRAACLVYDDQGRQVARYDKIHLFDVSLGESGETYRESDTIEPGSSPVVVDTPFGRMGIAVCYDLRFPEMFREMGREGVELLVIPSAFTATTGQAHWEILLRTRAVENLCYVVAAGQGGHHASGRDTFGDSMIVDPWGRIMQRLAQGPGLVTATPDLTLLKGLRENFPVLRHRRLDLWS